MNSINSLREKYGKDIQIIYKHLPLPFHPNAETAARYYESIRLQDGEKAWKFHDEILDNQGKLSMGEAYLETVAKKFNIDMTKLKKDLNSSVVTQRIEEDKKEANDFQIFGTPGFLLNGIRITGAQPVEEFEAIITKLKEKGLKLTNS